MPSGLPARVVVVFILIFGVSIAYAERRPVAVIDLSGEDPKAEQLARAFNPVLLGHPDLQPIPDPSMGPLLYGAFADDLSEIAAAGKSKGDAEERLANYSHDAAKRSAAAGQDRLRSVHPSLDALAMYAQLAFITGQAQLGIPREAAEAPRWFALANRLDPNFVPDPARYLPDVVQAFEASKRRWTGKGTLSVGGIGQLWIDGKEHGTAPVDSVEVDAGPHVVWLTGPDRIPNAKEVLVEPGKKGRVEIQDTPPKDKETKVRRARAALRHAPDATAKAASMKLLAELLGVRDAVLLTSPNKKIVIQLWNISTRDPGFSEFREVKNQKPIDLLTPLAPPKPKVDPPPFVKTPLVDNRRWYERRTWQASMVVGVVAAIVGGYYIYKAATADTFFAGGGISQGTGARVVTW